MEFNVSGDHEDIIEIFTDGACSGNPGPGGYGIIIRQNANEKVLSGFEPDTTNNRMEMTAVIEALKQLRGPSRVRIFTDSNYVIRGMTEWLPAWIRKNWLNSQKKPVLNRDLWEILLNVSKSHDIEWKWIRGHQGHVENERCDELARNAIMLGGL